MITDLHFDNLIESVTEAEQRAFIKISVILKQDASSIYKQLLQALGHRAYSLRATQKWVKDYKEGRVEVEDLPRPGRPNTARTPQELDRLRELLAENRSGSLREFAAHMNHSKSTIKRMLEKDLNMVKKGNFWVPRVTPLKEDKHEVRAGFVSRIKKKKNQTTRRKYIEDKLKRGNSTENLKTQHENKLENNNEIDLLSELKKELESEKNKQLEKELELKAITFNELELD